MKNYAQGKISSSIPQPWSIISNVTERLQLKNLNNLDQKLRRVHKKK